MAWRPNSAVRSRFFLEYLPELPSEGSAEGPEAAEPASDGATRSATGSGGSSGVLGVPLLARLMFSAGAKPLHGQFVLRLEVRCPIFLWHVQRHQAHSWFIKATNSTLCDTWASAPLLVGSVSHSAAFMSTTTLPPQMHHWSNVTPYCPAPPSRHVGVVLRYPLTPPQRESPNIAQTELATRGLTTGLSPQAAQAAPWRRRTATRPVPQM